MSSDELFDLFDDDLENTTEKVVEKVVEEIPENVEDLMEESVEPKKEVVVKQKEPKKEVTKETKKSSIDDLFSDDAKLPPTKTKFEKDVSQPLDVDKQLPKSNPVDNEMLDEDEVMLALLKEGFEFVEAKDSTKTVLMFYGRKGEGKTYATFKLPGTIACLSFDGKSVKIKNMFHKGEEGNRIKVYDAMQFYESYPEKEQLRTGKKTFLYVEYILEQLAKQEDKPDWIVIDGLERLHRISELVMRYDNNIMPYEGFKNLNLWKIRRACLAKVHSQAIRIANKGVAYTTYLTKERVADEVQDSEIASDVPKWIGVIMEHTDVVFKCYKKWLSQQLIFRVTIESSKDERFTTGRILNVTESGVFEQLGIDGI